VVTGNLVNSISTVLSKSTDTSAEADVGPAAVYGRIHELGGIAGHGSHIPARPYLRPAVDEHMGQIEDAVGAVLKDALEGATK
jgi:phage gpG-like protein